MSFPYAVVLFPQEGTYSEILTSWLTEDNNKCRWPRTRNVTFFLKKNSPPHEDWLLFDVKVQCYCETLEKARKKAEDANYVTSNDESTGRGKRIIHEKQFDDMYDTCDGNTDNDSDVPPQLHKTDNKKRVTKDKYSDTSVKKYKCVKQLSQIADKSSTPNRSRLCSKSQTQQINLVREELSDNNNELVVPKSQEINIQGKSSTLFYY
ncbi:PREDICTED: uncharacterized protein LOC105555651 [Vollenhovia emeryi]|uniref:uncharacterized protein LOC105555651 n=1 Tax=Vollenhovia emeryi TaxID=411798 RepID=UPI0005F3F6A8|nr:PREDICTED: uncharacterized protein LOC105555651 [Vollenhovia emeryi]XP_011858066.1 PREDICTED: uncharacterized protein LOC105555651 [Vollenhovia emeryi]